MRAQGSEKQGSLEMLQGRQVHRVLRLPVACQDWKVVLVRGQAVYHQVITLSRY